MTAPSDRQHNLEEMSNQSDEAVTATPGAQSNQYQASSGFPAQAKATPKSWWTERRQKSSREAFPQAIFFYGTMTSPQKFEEVLGVQPKFHLAKVSGYDVLNTCGDVRDIILYYSGRSGRDVEGVMGWIETEAHNNQLREHLASQRLRFQDCTIIVEINGHQKKEHGKTYVLVGDSPAKLGAFLRRLCECRPSRG